MAPAGGNFLWGLPANPQKMPNLYGLQAHPLTEEFFFLVVRVMPKNAFIFTYIHICLGQNTCSPTSILA